ncbi:MAG: PPC domain-containing protein [Pirellulaceae bacterium]|nr:PPC domain-containing protein [Pirellulaceae bacterium]
MSIGKLIGQVGFAWTLAAGSLVSGPLLAAGPTLKRIFPAGAGRGQTVEVAALGDAPKWPVKVWCDDTHVKWEALPDKGKFRVSVEAAARLGIHHVRFIDEDGATDALRFLVGPISEQNEVEPNDDQKKLTPVASLPRLINGVLEKRGDVDTFAVTLQANQVLVASLEANEQLRAPVDATLQVLSAGGVVLAQNLDSRGLDPLVVFHASQAGTYFVRAFGFPETPDSTIGYAGGEGFVYRLSLATDGWLQAVKPLAVTPTGNNELQLLGVKLPQSTASVTLPEKYSHTSWALDLPGLAHAPLIDVLPWPQSVEPTRVAGGPMPSIPVPGSITGAIHQYNERDFYSFVPKSAQKIRISLSSRRFGMPMDGVLRVMDQNSKQVAREDDTAKQADTKLTFQATAGTGYILEVTDAFNSGGPDWVYRIDVEPVQPELALSIKSDRLSGKLNEAIEVAVTIDRRDGFDKPVRVSAVGLPGSVQCEPVVSEKTGDTAKEVKLKLIAKESYSGPLTIQATIEGDETFSRTATLVSDSLVKDLWLIAK